MNKRRQRARQPATSPAPGKSPGDTPQRPAHPANRNFPQLVASVILFGLWLVFLVYVATLR